MDRRGKQGDISDMIGNQAKGTQGEGEYKGRAAGKTGCRGLNEIKTQSSP